MPSIGRLLALAVLSLQYVGSVPLPASNEVIARSTHDDLAARAYDVRRCDENGCDLLERDSVIAQELESRAARKAARPAVKKAARPAVKKPAVKKAAVKKPAVKKTVAKKPVAKKVTPKKATTVKKAAVKPAAKKVTTAKKTTAAKPATKAVAKKTTAATKKTTVKKTTAATKKTAAKPATKAAAKKTTAATKKTAAKPATKATAAKKPATSKAASKTTPKKATASKAVKSAAPSASAKAAACKLPAKGKKGKRAITHFTKSSAPASLSIDLNGKAFTLSKSPTQGNNAVVYRDTAGDFAKTPLSGSLAKEAENTGAVGQLKAFGIDQCTNTEWLVTTAARGKPFQETAAFAAAKAAGTCAELADKAVDLTVAKAKEIFTATGLNHGDLNAGNIFFNDDVSAVETLIDWGSATKRTSFPTIIAKGQAGSSLRSLC